MAAPIRVLVTDELPLICAAIATALESQDDLVVVGQAADDEQALDEARRVRPDVTVVDAGLPRGGGVELCASMKALELAGSVLVLSEQPDQGLLLAALEAGADGYLDRSVTLAQLTDGIRRVHAGDACIPPGMLGVLLRRLIQRRREEDRAMERFSRLSRREREVLGLIVAGHDNQGIAATLTVSAHTARTHVQNVLEKLGVQSRIEAAALAVEHHLIERFAGV